MRFFTWLVIAGMALSFPLSSLAVNLGADSLGNAGTNAGINTTGPEGSIAGVIGTIISAVLGILGVLLLIYFIYAGFLWMTARGEEKQIKKAKDIMANAVAGLVVTLVANSLVFFVIREVPGGSLLGTEDFTKVQTEAGLTTSLLIEDNIGSLIAIILNLLGVLLLLIFLYAGFLWMTAQGDDKQTKKAKDMMRNAVAGLVIILVSRILANFVIEQLAGELGVLTTRKENVTALSANHIPEILVTPGLTRGPAQREKQ